jgi:hypothetical protein
MKRGLIVVDPSMIIPAYDEENRIERMIKACVEPSAKRVCNSSSS